MLHKSLSIFIVGLLVAGSAHAAPPIRFTADLEGFNAAGQPVITDAFGKAVVEVIDDGTALEFRVDVKKIFNLLMAHIHIKPLQPGGESVPVAIDEPAGPVAYWFVGGPPPGEVVRERVQGTLARGLIITNGEVQSWDPTDPLDGTVAGVINAIAEGRASVVVHTDDLNPDTPTGMPGDSRAGELRGTLQ